jgi:DNA-binding Lrp family transcriptional regulator
MTDEILLEIQYNFPLTQKPFRDIGNKFGLSEDEVIAILTKQKQDSVIRQTSAIFDTKRLGYKSSLVAFEIEDDDIEDAINFINNHPGISHNYLRSHQYNIWFTIALPPNSKLTLEQTINFLAKKTKAKHHLILPTLKMFKIAVKLDTTKNKSIKEEVVDKVYTSIELNDEYYKIIELLQKDIEFVSEPFKYIVDSLGITYERFFEVCQELLKSGVMRRFATILNHKKAGFNSNAMVVWEIDENKAMEIGRKAASFSSVSHCYLRPVYTNWQYNLFTMIHAQSNGELQDIINLIADEIEFKSNMVLHSLKEFKKVRIIYFSNEFEKFEQRILDEVS